MSEDTKICFIGDCHGKIHELMDVLSQLPPEVRKIQVGDIALGFPNVNLPKIDLIKENCWFRFIRGNHDSPSHCRAHFNYLGDSGYNPTMKLFWVGGAFSIDYKIRQDRMSFGGSDQWWADEELSADELKAAFDLYVSKKPEIVVTHEAPSSIGVELITQLAGFRPEKLECPNSRTAIALEDMFRAHQPKRWYFGHYHVDKTIAHRGTRFRCLNELSHEIYDPEEEA